VEEAEETEEAEEAEKMQKIQKKAEEVRKTIEIDDTVMKLNLRLLIALPSLFSF